MDKDKESKRIFQKIIGYMGRKPLKAISIATLAALTLLGPCRALKYELDNRTTSGEGSVTGTTQKIKRDGPKVWGMFYLPFNSTFNGFMLLSKSSGMRKDDRLWYSLDRDSSINFTIKDPRWPKDKRYVDTQEKLMEIINMCDGKEGTIKFINPKKKQFEVVIPAGEKYVGDRNTGYIEVIKEFDKKVRETYLENGEEKTREVVKKYQRLKITQWIIYSWRGIVSDDIREEDTYNRDVNLVREFIPGEECIIENSGGLEKSTLSGPEKRIVTSTTTTIPSRYSSTTIPLISTTTTTQQPKKEEKKDRYFLGFRIIDDSEKRN